MVSVSGYQRPGTLVSLLEFSWGTRSFTPRGVFTTKSERNTHPCEAGARNAVFRSQLSRVPTFVT